MCNVVESHLEMEDLVDLWSSRPKLEDKVRAPILESLNVDGFISIYSILLPYDDDAWK